MVAAMRQRLPREPGPMDLKYYIFYSYLRLLDKRQVHFLPSIQETSPSTAWNIDCRAWLMICPFQASVSV